MADLSHLLGRCGSCSRWAPIDLGSGVCSLPGTVGGPTSLSDPGGLYTRIDFSCAWHEPEPGTEPPALHPLAGRGPAPERESADLDRPPLGVYRVIWVDGSSSVASIYMDAKGDRWLAPANWTAPGLLRIAYGQIGGLYLMEGTDG